jgi:transketolase N-terminal domain/subunit
MFGILFKNLALGIALGVGIGVALDAKNNKNKSDKQG